MSLDYVDARPTELVVWQTGATFRLLSILIIVRFELVPLEELAYQFGFSACVVDLVENVVPADRIAGLIFVRPALEQNRVVRCAARLAIWLVTGDRFSISRIGFTIYTGACFPHLATGDGWALSSVFAFEQGREFYLA